jgi:hypothetical protein
MHQLIIPIKMKNLKILKIATIIAFLIIVFPGKIYFINGQMLFLIFIQFFLMIGVEPIISSSFISFLLSSLSILSMIFIFKKSRLITFACLLIQYLWLANCFNQRDLDNIYYISTMCLYFILSLILSYFLFLKKNE